MRCPKCSNSFQVLPDGTTRAASSASAPPKPRPKRKMTQVGLGPSVAPPGPPPPPKPVAGPGKSSSSAAPSLSHEDVDLPAPLSPPPLADLPAPKIGGASLDLDPFGDAPTAVDLPAPKTEAEPRPSGFDPFADMDLPAPMEGASETDLPAPLGHGHGGVDLPAPMSSTDRGGTDLPALRGGGSFEDEIDLPMALTDAELPAPISMSSDLPMSLEQENLPVPRDDFSDPPLDGPIRDHGGGPIELDLPDGEDLSLDMELDPGVNRPAPVPPLPTVGGTPGPASERPDPGARVNRDSAELDLPVSDDLEFSELPSLEEGEADVHRMPHPGDGTRAPTAKHKRSIDIRRALAKKRPPWLMKLVAAAVGASFVLGLGFYLGNTKYGLFGVHVVEPFLPGAGDVVETTLAVQSAEADAADDTYTSTRQGLAQLEGALGSARLNRALVARALLHQSFFQIRYGQEAQSAAEADAHRMHLKRRGDEAPGIHVALAANALRQNDLALAQSELALAKAEDASDPYVDLVEGELALAGKDPKSAADAFGRAFSKDGSARAQWGIARSHRLAGNAQDLVAAANATLEASPAHAGARVAVAEGLAAQGDTDGAYALLQAPAGLVPD
ncbi:MAG: hypothetical protein WBG86_04025, partial [Polyangiales bacterium]